MADSPIRTFSGPQSASISVLDRTGPARGEWRIDSERPMSYQEILAASDVPPDSQEVSGKLLEAGENFLFGPSLGRSMVNVTTAIFFPPYAIYLVGNVLLSLAGHDPVYITDALPEEERKELLSVYGAVTDVPGRVSAFIAGTEFRSE